MKAGLANRTPATKIIAIAKNTRLCTQSMDCRHELKQFHNFTDDVTLRVPHPSEARVGSHEVSITVTVKMP